MSDRAKLISLTSIAVLVCLLFLFFQIGSNWDYILPKRTLKLLTIILVGCSIAFSTVIFQTITNNKILTPSILGLDSLYLFIQTFVIFWFGSSNEIMMNNNTNFLISVLMMILFSGLLFRTLFRKENQNIYFLLIIGVIFGTFFQSLSDFMTVLINPNEFLMVQDKMFASFNNINTELLLIASIVTFIVCIYFLRFAKYMDVLSLGRDHAINLGVSYHSIVKHLLIIVAILTAVSTALVGPITFLGLLVANTAYQLFHTYQHKTLIFGACLISILSLVIGQLLVERIFTFSTTISVIINFIGGIYFIYLLLKENRSW